MPEHMQFNQTDGTEPRESEKILKRTLQSRLVVISAVAGMVGPILFAIILTILGNLSTGNNPLTQTGSELGATNAPTMELQALNFAIIRIVTTIFAVGLTIHNGRF